MTLVCLALAGAALAQGQPSPPLGGFSIGVRPQLIDLTGPAGAKRSFDVFVKNFDTLRPAKVWLWPAALARVGLRAVGGNGADVIRARPNLG